MDAVVQAVSGVGGMSQRGQSVEAGHGLLKVAGIAQRADLIFDDARIVEWSVQLRSVEAQRVTA